MSLSSILATKILLISSGVVFLAMVMKSTIIPWSINLIVSELPMIWSFFVSLCKPPYLYIVINGIIITIAVSSRFSRTGTEMEGSSATMTPSNLEHFQPTRTLIETHEHDMFVHGVSNHVVDEVAMVDVIKNPVAEEAVVEVKVEEEVRKRVEAPPPRKTNRPQESEVVLPVPRALSRFGPPKASLEDKKEVKMEGGSIDGQQVTLESMWKTIMEGREEEPLDPLMKKCALFDDLEDENPCHKETSSAPPSSQVLNPTSFKGRTNYICESESPVKSWILKKEPSLGQDELNRRADVFIQQFNEEMRMQRQQSLMQNIKGELSY